MVKYVKENGEVLEINRKQFVNLIKILKKRAKKQHEMKIIEQMTEKWN